MATINFMYRSIKKIAPLNLRLLFRQNDIDYVIGARTKYDVSKHYWEKQHKLRRSKDIEISNKQTEVNNELNKIENHVLNAFKLAEPSDINKAWLQSIVENYYNPPKKAKALPTELLKYFELFLEYKENEITKSSIKKYKVVKNLLAKYEDSIDKTLLIVDVDASFKKEFEEYCLVNQYAPNTVAWAIRSIKTVCNHAGYNGLETNRQLDSIRLKSSKVKNIYLSFDELERIEIVEDKKLTESFDNARDWLIISCYTGQRISDFMKFTKELIRIEKGKHLLEFTQRKTGKIMTIPLHKKVLRILDKRDGNFPRPISSQKYNDYIKVVCKIAELNEEVEGSKKVEVNVDGDFPYRNEFGTFKKWELVTSHIGRRSFATNFYGQIPTSFLIYITGHSTEQMFLNYIGKSNKDLAIEITKYF